MTSPRSSRKTRERTDAPLQEPTRIAGWLLLVLAVPRIVRLLYPAVWVEDDFYLESAYLVASGLRPYLDFVHPHLPVLEWLAGAYLKVVGASHARIELLNESAIYASSVLTFVLARRALGERAAMAAALLFAFSSLSFRYHAYERECFVAPLVLGAAIVATDRGMSALRQIGWLAALLALACSIKLTSGIEAAVVLGYLATAERRIGRAVLVGMKIVGALAVLSALCYWLYGFEFLFQTFLFHFLKGRDLSAASAFYPAEILDLLAPLFVLGVARVAIERRVERTFALVLAMVAAEYAFFGVISPTAWAHNYLDALPFIAIVAGWGLMWIIDAVRELIAGDQPERAVWVRVIAGGVLILLGLAWATPLINENWLRGSIYGFGFVPREEIAQLASALAGATAPDEQVVAPAFIAFEANRRELIRYPETYGVWREAEAEYRRDGFAKSRAHLGNEDFFRLIVETSHFWTAELNDAVSKGTVNAVIVDSRIQLLPLVYVPEDALIDAGFKPALRTEHFALWVRSR